MTEKSLPKAVVEKDHKLAKAGEELVELRWHWTRDPKNAKRVSVEEYAEDVGVHPSTIKRDATAWEEWLKAKKSGVSNKPGAPKTITDFRKLAERSEDQKTAIKAVAAATNTSPAWVARRKTEEVQAVVNAANARVVRKAQTGKPSTMEHEIKVAATDRAKRAEAAKAERVDKKKKRTMNYLKVEGKLAQMIARGGEVLDLAEGMDFDADEIALLKEALGKVRALLGLIDLRIAGETNVDWDAEFQKIATG
jgi:IS30 family transposase